MKAFLRGLEICNQDEAYYLRPENILYVKADGNYCDIHLTDGDVLESVSCQRAEIARMIDTQLPSCLSQKFALLGRSYLVNVEHIMYVNAGKQTLAFDINQPGMCKKQTIKISTEALRNLRISLEGLFNVMQSSNMMETGGAINGGFTDYMATPQKEKNYDTQEDEVKILGIRNT